MLSELHEELTQEKKTNFLLTIFGSEEKLSIFAPPIEREKIQKYKRCTQ